MFLSIGKGRSSVASCFMQLTSTFIQPMQSSITVFSGKWCVYISLCACQSLRCLVKSVRESTVSLLTCVHVAPYLDKTVSVAVDCPFFCYCPRESVFLLLSTGSVAVV